MRDIHVVSSSELVFIETLRGFLLLLSPLRPPLPRSLNVKMKKTLLRISSVLKKTRVADLSAFFSYLLCLLARSFFLVISFVFLGFPVFVWDYETSEAEAEAKAEAATGQRRLTIYRPRLPRLTTYRFGIVSGKKMNRYQIIAMALPLSLIYLLITHFLASAVL